MRLLPSLALAGVWQMAIDRWMLEQRQPLLRFYRWRRPTLSLGFHQRRLEPAWLELVRAGVLDLVRRPSGGRAVLHGGDLTYALVWPGASGPRQQVYGQACRWLQQAFADLALPLQFGIQAAGSQPGQQPASCFALSTAADLVHAGGPWHGAKRIGSAQLWRDGCLLQHGSIQLQPDPQLWQRLFGMAPPALPPLPWPVAELQQQLEACLIGSAAALLPPAGAGLLPVAITATQWQRIEALVADQEVALEALLASPEATMARTTGASASPRG